VIGVFGRRGGGVVKQEQKKIKGFTLIETLVCMVLLSFFALGISMFMKPISELWSLQSFQQDAAYEERLALLRMARDIEGIKDRTSITSASASAFSFTDVNNAAIAYTLTSGTLKRNAIPLAKGVSSLQFQYIGLTASGVDTTIASPVVSPSSTNIRRIKISLTVTANGHSASSQVQVNPRNLY